MSPALPGRVGERLAIRYAGADGPTEAVGEIVAVDDATLTLLPEGAPALTVPRSAIAAARAVPPRAVRPVSPIEDVELLAARGWPGLTQERLGGWLLRAGAGASGRANSCLPLGDPGMPAPEAVARVQEWYDARGLRPCFQVPRALGPRYPAFRRAPQDVSEHLARQGWSLERATTVLVGDLRRMAPRATPYPLRSAWAESPDEPWWTIDGADPPRRREAVSAPARYLTVREQAGGVVAAGRLALIDDWCGLSNLTVVPAKRGRGHGRRALEAMLAEGARAGARFAYLQVMESNAVGLGLYESHGFARHHAYAYAMAPLGAERVAD